MTTSRSLATEIENILSYLVSAELALFANPVVVDPDGRVTWRSARAAGKVTTGRRPNTASDYRHWVETGAYSTFLLDGSLLQITYEFVGNQLVGHRLAYVPSPFQFDRDLLLEESLVDVFDLYAGGSASDVGLRAVIRFDYDPDSWAPGHPETHLTMNAWDCRLACVGPLGAARFVDFVFRHFYADLFAAHPSLKASSNSGFGQSTLTSDEASGFHMSWRV